MNIYIEMLWKNIDTFLLGLFLGEEFIKIYMV